MSLATGRRLNRQIFTSLPLPKDVINSVHRLARRNTRGLGIEDRDRCPFLEAVEGPDDDTGNSTYTPDNEDNSENGDESNDNDNNNATNFKPPPD